MKLEPGTFIVLSTRYRRTYQPDASCTTDQLVPILEIGALPSNPTESV